MARLASSIFILIVTFIGSSRLYAAGPIVGFTETSLTGGLWRYDYTVSNANDPASQPKFNLYDIIFQFPSAPTVLSVPSGWASITYLNSVEVFSTDVGEPAVVLSSTEITLAVVHVISPFGNIIAA